MSFMSGLWLAMTRKIQSCAMQKECIYWTQEKSGKIQNYIVDWFIDSAYGTGMTVKEVMVCFLAQEVFAAEGRQRWIIF